jgi:very-short-patch-repair endonuclease
MTNSNFDRAVVAVARRQHGVLSHDQAVAAGGSDTMISSRVRSGSWVRLVRGVYALATYQPTWQRQYKAAELSKPGSAIRGRPAGMVHGFDGFRVLRPELWVPHGTSVRRTIADVRRGSSVPIEVVHGIRVTSSAQTLLDVLADCPVDRVERAMDGALLSGRLDLGACDERLAAMAGRRRRHVSTFEALVAERRAEGWAPPESKLERVLGTILNGLRTGVAMLRQRSDLPWWERGEGRVDYLVPEWSLVVEADGRRWHARVADFDRDRWRDNVAQAHGYRVLRFTHTHMTQRPGEVLDLVVATRRWRTVAA